MDLKEQIMKTACNHIPPSHALLYPLRRLFAKNTDFSDYLIKSNLRTPITNQTHKDLVLFAGHLLESLHAEEYLDRYYVNLLLHNLYGLSID